MPRLMLGLVCGLVYGALSVFGVLLSLADAIITKAYAPIIVLGAIGGTIIGLIVDKWGS